MGDYAIRMRFDIDAEPERVRHALTSIDGIKAWWSTMVGGDPGTDGGRFEVSFPDAPVPFDFLVSLDGEVSWAVGENPEHWKGTGIHWNLSPKQDGSGTSLGFVHDGYDPSNPVIEIVTPAWAMIILRLKQYAETGERQPFFDF